MIPCSSDLDPLMQHRAHHQVQAMHEGTTDNSVDPVFQEGPRTLEPNPYGKPGVFLNCSNPDCAVLPTVEETAGESLPLSDGSTYRLGESFGEYYSRREAAIDSVLGELKTIEETELSEG